MSTFADLGFSNIILQFSAHEFAFLSIKGRALVGEERYIQKLGSFFRFVVKWLSLMCSLAYPVIFLVGIFFFHRDAVLDIYLIPWIVYSAGSLINFFSNSVLSFIEGLNQIDKIQRSRFFVAVIHTLVIVIGLMCKLNIYALAFAMIFSSSFMFVTIFVTFGKIIKQLWHESKDFFYPWRKEILPLFRKYVLSFASGYFLFQIYTPLMHYFHGAVLGGKVGITMSLVMAMFSFSNIWMYTITPRINILIEKKSWNVLDKLFHKRLLLSLLSYILICMCFVLFVVIFGKYGLIARVLERFLPYKAMVLLIVSYFLQLIVNAWAVYLRGHKQEPFWWTSIISAIWVFLITLFAGKFLSPMLFFIGLLTSYFWGIPLSYYIFCKDRNKWHR